MLIKNKAHKVCEQLLSIMKSSQLTYVVRETSYSAFITTRKRFIRDSSSVTLGERTNRVGERIIGEEKQKHAY